MKKRKFNAKAMRKFTTEPKVVHEAKPIDLITQYNRMRSIATDIYNSDFFMISSKAEQKKIEASIACISATMISMIGMEAIENSHDCLPDDSGNGNDHSWDNLPDDSGNGTDTDKDAHDAIKKMMNIAYGKDETDGVKKAAARQTLNSMYGVLGSHDASNAEVEFSHTPYKSRHINDRATPIMAMNRRILSELGIKSPADKPNEDPSAFGNEYDEVTDDDSDSDEVIDYSEVNLGNFIEGSSYGQQYLNICRQYGFDAAETLKQIEKLASQQYIQMINLVDVVDSQNEITADKYTLEPGSVFFVTNKNDESRSPVFMLIYAQPYTKVRSSDISKFSFEIKPVESEESTKTNYIDFVNSDAYFNIGKVHLNPNSNQVIDLDATLEKIKDEARAHGIDTITFVDTIGNSLDIYTKGKYTLEPGSLFCHRGNGWLNFMLIIKDKNTPETVRFIWPVEKPEENASLDDIEFIGIDAYYKIDKACPNSDMVIDLDATLAKIKEKAKKKDIKTITFVDTIKEHSDLYANSKYSLEPGSLFFVKEDYLRFILINKTSSTFHYIDPVMVIKKDDSEEDSSDSKKDDIEFVGADDYYKIDKACPNSTIIDLDATLAKIKERAKAKNIKTITFAGIIKGFYEIFYKGKYYQAGSLFYTKNDERTRFILITGTIDYVNLPQYEHIDPVVVFKNDDSEDEADSKEDGIEAVEAEDEILDSDEASSEYGINDQYADADTSKLNLDLYAKVSFPIFMKPTDSGTDVSFAQICDLYDFDISETVKRIKNAAYLEEIEKVNYIDSFQTFDDIFKTEMAQRWYGYHDGSLFLVRESTKGKLDPCFVLLRKPHDDSDFDDLLYRINPIMRTAKIHGIKKIDIIDTYADGDVRIANDLKNLIDIEHTYKIKEICDKRKYNYDNITSCLKGVTAIIGGGMRLTFEGTVSSLNSIILVDPVVAYNTCSVFFVSNFVCCEEEAYFVIYMPITGKTKNGCNFRLYRINPILNLNQDTNTDSQDDSNVREINQFTAIYRANLEVSEADKDAYMKVEFSLINHSANRAIDSLQNICYTWKFKFYDTIKRIRFVAYMNNFKEIKFAGTACSHEEILEKEVLYSNGSVVFVSDAEDEDPHFVIVEFVDGSTCLNRINPVKE